VDYADNVANSYVEFSISQTGIRKLTFRYANGSTVNRTCSITLNGNKVDTFYFQPTGSWTTWNTASLTLDLGPNSGNKALRVTSATNAGGPNLDSLTVR
jgi:hypothetical protein